MYYIVVAQSAAATRLSVTLLCRQLSFRQYVSGQTMGSRGLIGHEQEFLDSLHVMEVGMRHFFAKAMHAKANKGKPETIDANMLQAVSIAEKIAPYKHARLSAVKLAGDPNNPARFKDDATADELRAELMKRVKILVSAGLIDLKALRRMVE
jgi:hypothetical protein